MFTYTRIFTKTKNDATNQKQAAKHGHPCQSTIGKHFPKPGNAFIKKEPSYLLLL